MQYFKTMTITYDVYIFNTININNYFIHIEIIFKIKLTKNLFMNLSFNGFG